MDEIKCTVVIITYNHVKYIARAIESVIAQKTKYRFKIVIADDASIDGTSDVCKEYKKKYSDLIDYQRRQRNIGAFLNTWTTLKEIDSTYFCCLDGDDFWCDENKLQLCIDIMDSNHCYSMVAHNTFVSLKEDEPIIYHGEKNLILSNSQKSYFDEYITWNDEMYYMKKNKNFLLPASSGIFYRTKCVDFKSLPLFSVGHLVMWLLFLKKGDCYYVNRVMSVYNCYNSSSISSGKVRRSEWDRHVVFMKYYFAIYKLSKWFVSDAKYFRLCVGKRWYCTWKSFFSFRRNFVLVPNADNLYIDVCARKSPWKFVFLNLICKFLCREKVFKIHTNDFFLFLKSRRTYNGNRRLLVKNYGLRHSIINKIALLLIGVKLFRR